MLLAHTWLLAGFLFALNPNLYCYRTSVRDQNQCQAFFYTSLANRHSEPLAKEPKTFVPCPQSFFVEFFPAGLPTCTSRQGGHLIGLGTNLAVLYDV